MEGLVVGVWRIFAALIGMRATSAETYVMGGWKMTWSVMRLFRRAGLLSISVLALIGLVLVATPATAGKSPWLDRDDPTAKGDFETAEDQLTLNCRIKGTNQPIGPGNTPQGYVYQAPRGGCWCVNAEEPSGQCKDIEARYFWFGPGPIGDSTPWLDRDNPSGKGDFETTEDLLKVKCRIIGTHKRVKEGKPNEGYHRAVPNGGCWCVNDDAPGGCQDIEVQYTW